MYTVYWIRKDNHTDVKKEGYIGITINYKNRFAAHQCKRNKSRVSNAIRKYEGKIVYEIIAEGLTAEEAKEYEIKLRPEAYIGWNVAEGGGLPPSIKDNEEVKRKISESIKSLGVVPYCENTHSPAAIAKRKAAMTGRKWYHDPKTGASTLTHDDCPDGWMPGKKNKTEWDWPKIKGQNVKVWKLQDLNGNIHYIENLKNWCRDKNLKYLHMVGGKTLDGWTVIEKTQKVRQWHDYYQIALEHQDKGFNINPEQYANHMIMQQEKKAAKNKEK